MFRTEALSKPLVANNLVAVMVLTEAKDHNAGITEDSFSTFIGYKDIKTKIISEYQANKDVPGLWVSYVKELSFSGSDVIYVPDDYSSIQSAVENATAGDEIIVRDGKLRSFKVKYIDR